MSWPCDNLLLTVDLGALSPISNTVVSSPDRRLYKPFRGELNSLQNSCSFTLDVGERFQCYRRPSETSAPNLSSRLSMHKIQWVHKQSRVDWSNFRNSPVLSRLDGFLYTTQGCTKFEDHFYGTPTRISFDHFPCSWWHST